MNRYQAFCKFVQFAPDMALQGLFDIAYPVYRKLHTNRAYGRVEAHLRATGLDQKTNPREVFENLYWNFIDAVRYLRRSPRILQRITFENEELIRTPIAQGLPVVALSIHQGAYEMLHRALCRYSRHIHLFIHQFPNKDIADTLHELRTDPAIEEHDTAAVAYVIRQFFRDKGVLAMLVDQAKDAHGNAVTICGLPATLYLRLPVKVNQMGASIVTFRTYRKGREHIIRFEKVYAPGTDPQALVKGISAEVSGWITEHPEQWTWNYHKNFIPPKND